MTDGPTARDTVAHRWRPLLVLGTTQFPLVEDGPR